ncbi:Sodium/hydrogen exchanger family-domain-containing protein [Phlebopus sp. FC_14]|nr:Sodium/hydrogen exchanger family-domain-containing protein [Phlebopus sp. FC_14]
MLFHPLSLTIPHIAYACLGGFVVVFGMFSLFIREKLYIGEACWAFLFGVIIGPYGAGIFDPRGWANHNEQVTNTITLEFTRVVLAIGVFAIGVELPKAYMARHWKSLFFLLVPVMTWGWFVSAGLIYALIPGINFLSSLAVAACLTPTDPILAAAVVGGKYADKHVPAHIRHLLAAESGCNDGAAYPFLFIALYLILDSSPGEAVRDWFLMLWLFQILLSVVFGSLLGFGFRHLMKFCERNDLIDRQSYVAQYVSLAFLTIGIMTMLGSDDLLAAFFCGTVFAWDGFFNRQTEESVFSSVIDLLFNVAAFVYVGAWMPFDNFTNETLTLSVWRLVVIAILVLILKRLPIMIILYKFIPDVKTFREAVFSGHFGPIGIGAVYISTLAVEYLPTPADPPANQTEFLASTIQPIVAFMVLCSVAIHGLSIPFFSLGRRVHSVSSRTWSRHALGPDWATHTRLVTRAEDVVINRDLEKGETASADDVAEAIDRKRESTTTDMTTVTTTMRPHPSLSLSPSQRDNVEAGSSGSAETKTEMTPRDEEAMKEENPPDGRETTLVWREGPHKVVERRAGPGQEVDVEVIRHAYEPAKERISSHLKAVEGTALQTARAYLRQFRHHTQPSKEKDIQEVGAAKRDTDKHGAHEVATTAIPTSGLTGENPDQTSTIESGVNEDEEGWASDESVEDQATPTVSSGAMQQYPHAGDRRKRPKSGKVKGVPKHQGGAGFGKKTRRRSSTSESVASLSGHAQQQLPETESISPTSPTSPTSPITPISPSASEKQERQGDELSDRRGRRASSRQSTDRSTTTRRSLQHRRLESLRQGEQPRTSRDTSPARSVRFADLVEESGKTAPTDSSTPPRAGSNGTLSQNERDAWLMNGRVEDSPVEDDAGSMRGRVTFDLPVTPKR